MRCSSTETLDADDKFFCDVCQCLQEAQKRMKIKQLPQVLCLHLKRFKYIEQHDRSLPALSPDVADQQSRMIQASITISHNDNGEVHGLAEVAAWGAIV